MGRSARLAALPVLLLAMAPAVAGPEQAPAFDQGRDAAREALRANPVPGKIDPLAVPGLPTAPLPLETLSGNPGRARQLGTERRAECARAEDPTPECAGSAATSQAQPWLERYPLTHDDAVFNGMAAGEIDPGLVPAGDAGTCQTLTTLVTEEGADEFTCVSRPDGIRPEDLLSFSSPAGGALTASVGDGDGGVRSIDISTGGWITNLLFGVHDLSLTISVADPSLVGEARLTRIRHNDWGLVAINGTAAYVGPRGGDRLEVVGFDICHTADTCTPTWDFGQAEPPWVALGIDLVPLLVPGENTIMARLVHGGAGKLDLQGRIVMSRDDPEQPGAGLTIPGRPEAPTCAELEGRDCFQDRLGRCLAQTADGRCARQELHYRCPRQAATETVVCPPQDGMFCADGSCFDQRDTPTTADEFARSVLALEAARQSGSHLDPESLRLFSGFAARCRSRAFGLTDCCEPDTGGGGMSNSDLHSALATAAVENGIRFAGSTHVYDALFLADAPDLLLDLFPSSGLSHAPGVSFYGIQVSHTAGSGVVVGFDPAAFAIAVALAVAQALLACDQDEQVLALRNGRGLCETVGTHCTRRTLFGCSTETTVFCCHNSRLARAIAAGGRAQIGRGWGTPAHPDCSGLTEGEIRRIDLGEIDVGPALRDVLPADAGQFAEMFRERARTFTADAAEGEDE